MSEQATGQASDSSIVSEMRAFALERNPVLQTGRRFGYSEVRTFFIKEEVPPELFEKITPEVTEVEVGFKAMHVSGGDDEQFAYSLRTSLARSLSELRPDQLEQIDPETRALYDDFAELDDYGLQEATTVELGASDCELGLIDTVQSYELRYMGDVILRNTSQDMLEATTFEFVRVDPSELDDEDTDVLYVPEAIEQDSLPAADQIITSSLFFDFVKSVEDMSDGMTYDSALLQARAIIHLLRYGYQEEE